LKGPPLGNTYDRDIFRLALPALGALAAEPLYVLVDTAVVGRLGTPQLGGLAIASTILLTGYVLFIFLAYGTTASVARLVGAGDRRAAAHEGVQGLWLALAIGVGLIAVVLPVAPHLVRLMGGEGAVAENALVYLRISMIGVPALLMMQAGTGYLRGLQNAVTPLLVTLATVVANLAIELVLIYGFDQGIGASALATVVAQLGGAAVYVRTIARDVRARDVALRPDPAALRRLAAVGRDLFIRTASLRLSLTLGTAVAARLGVVELGAYQIAFELWSFTALVLDSLAIAGQAITGRLLGAGDAERARAAGQRMIGWGVAAGGVFAVVIAVLRPALPTLFTNDQQVIALCAFLLWFVAALQPINAVVFVLDGILIGAGDMRFLAKAMVVAAVVFVPAALAVIALDLGIGWLWGALALLMLTRMVALLLRFITPAWQVTGAAPKS
jgi:putative MATE family efflux protein